ncbi:MAG: hypothetical protein QXT67_08105 [Candidatus Bathyarchaeia archaeon]
MLMLRASIRTTKSKENIIKLKICCLKIYASLNVFPIDIDNHMPLGQPSFTGNLT